MKVTTANWGKRLAIALKERELTQKEAAKIANVTPSVLSGWLAGASPNDFIAVKKLADHLKISFTWLLTNEHESLNGSPALCEVFDEDGSLFNGYAKIQIVKLIPRNGARKYSD